MSFRPSLVVLEISELVSLDTAMTLSMARVEEGLRMNTPQKGEREY